MTPELKGNSNNMKEHLNEEIEIRALHGEETIYLATEPSETASEKISPKRTETAIEKVAVTMAEMTSGKMASEITEASSEEKTGGRLLWLFAVNFYISAFTFGGGYVVIPMIRKYFVEKKNLFTEEALLDMAAIAQSSPGAIAVNLSVLAGYRTAGAAGAFVSGLGSLLPPLLILSCITVFYDAFRSAPLIAAVLKGMEAGAAALVVDVVADMILAVTREKRPFLTLLVPLTFAAVFLMHISPLWMICGAVAVGLAGPKTRSAVQSLCLTKRGKEDL